MSRERWETLLLGVMGIALGWAVVIWATGGIHWETAGFKIASRDPLRPLVITGLCGLLFWRLAPHRVAGFARRAEQALSGRLSLVAVGVSAVITVVGVTAGAHAVGGSDSYGYVSEAHLWLTGRLTVDQRWLRLPAPFDDRALAPLGYKPGAEPGTLVPSYAPGFPLLIAAAQLMAGPEAAYYVVPLLGGVTVWLTFAFGRVLFNERVGLGACLLLAASPVFLFQGMLPLLTLATMTEVMSQTLTPRSPTFEVASIKRNASGGLGQTWRDRPDGGLMATNMPVTFLISRAYPPAIPIEMIGLPDWARTERYDVGATASLAQPTSDQRRAMLRALLAERFQLTVHVEPRDQEVYDLTLARRDGKLGPGIQATATNCEPSASGSARGNGTAGVPPPPQRPDITQPPPPCILRTVSATVRDRLGDRSGEPGDVLEGDAPIDTLALMLRPSMGRPVINKTGLTGSYRMRMTFDMTAATRAPDVVAPSPTAPSVFTAVQEQLGMKLQSSHGLHDALVIDRLERPTED